MDMKLFEESFQFYNSPIKTLTSVLNEMFAK